MPVDWGWVAEKTPGFITGAKDVILGGAAICTTFFAWKALSKWREETIGKRRLELAEHVLTGFYEAREVIGDARSPLVWANEAVREEGVPDEVSRSVYYAAVRRLRQSGDKLSDLQTKRHQFAAIFGLNAAKPWDEINSVITDIHVASQALLDLKGEHVSRDDPSADFYISQRRVLARHPDATDQITQRVDAAVKAIEAVCIPIIRASAH